MVDYTRHPPPSLQHLDLHRWWPRKMLWKATWLRCCSDPVLVKTYNLKIPHCYLLYVYIIRKSNRTSWAMKYIPIWMNVHCLVRVASIQFFLQQSPTSMLLASARFSFKTSTIVLSAIYYYRQGHFDVRSLIWAINDWSGDPTAWGQHLTLCWFSYTVQSSRHAPWLYSLLVVLLSHPSRVQSPQCQLHFSWFQQQRTQPREVFVKSPCGLYQHHQRMILATSRHHITFEVDISGQ